MKFLRVTNRVTPSVVCDTCVRERQVSTPSLGVGYKIALMIHQRCKPCLCLFNKNKGRGEGDPATDNVLPHMLTGDKNLDVSVFLRSVLLFSFVAVCSFRSIVGIVP